MSTYRINGRVIDRKIGFGIPDLRVEAWDKDLFFDDKVGSTVTDDAGAFEIIFDETYFRGLFFDRKPDLYFKIYRQHKLIENTKDKVLWNVSTQEVLLNIETDATAEEVENYHRQTGIVEKTESPIRTRAAQVRTPDPGLRPGCGRHPGGGGECRACRRGG